MSEQDSVVEGLLASDPSLFTGDTAQHSLGWLHHPEMYFGTWLDEISEQLPRRHDKTVLLAMGGSSSPARFFNEFRQSDLVTVLDTSNPDSIAQTSFQDVNVIAASKSGATIETSSLLTHALHNGLSAKDLVVISDPGTSLTKVGESLGALTIAGDPQTGGRFSGLSPFGLIPALYAGWSAPELRQQLAPCCLNRDLVERACREVQARSSSLQDGMAFFSLHADPINSGSALWLEQLIAESTGKDQKGFIPILDTSEQAVAPGAIQYFHLVAALLARTIGVDPFNQPNVERAKRDVLDLLKSPVSWDVPQGEISGLHQAMSSASYIALQVFGPLSDADDLIALRSHVERLYGPTTANFGPRYLHSTGQLHKGGPAGVVAIQLVMKPRSKPVKVAGEQYSFHDIHFAQALSDQRAMQQANRPMWQFIVNDLNEAARILAVEA